MPDSKSQFCPSRLGVFLRSFFSEGSADWERATWALGGAKYALVLICSELPVLGSTFAPNSLGSAASLPDVREQVFFGSETSRLWRRGRGGCVRAAAPITELLICSNFWRCGKTATGTRHYWRVGK